MSLIIMIGFHRADTGPRQRCPPAPAPRPTKPRRFQRTVDNLAAVTASVIVPAHGYLKHVSRPNIIPWRIQTWEFLKQIVRGCAMAAAIGAAVLVYTAFVQKWKERGWPAIPIAALGVISEQATRSGTTQGLPLAGQSSGQYSSPRQTTLLDLDNMSFRG